MCVLVRCQQIIHVINPPYKSQGRNARRYLLNCLIMTAIYLASLNGYIKIDQSINQFNK